MLGTMLVSFRCLSYLTLPVTLCSYLYCFSDKERISKFCNLPRVTVRKQGSCNLNAGLSDSSECSSHIIGAAFSPHKSEIGRRENITIPVS